MQTANKRVTSGHKTEGWRVEFHLRHDVMTGTPSKLNCHNTTLLHTSHSPSRAMAVSLLQRTINDTGWHICLYSWKQHSFAMSRSPAFSAVFLCLINVFKPFQAQYACFKFITTVSTYPGILLVMGHPQPLYSIFRTKFPWPTHHTF